MSIGSKWTELKKNGLNEKQLSYLLLLPTISIIGMVFFLPIVMSIWYSLHKIDLISPASGQPWVGIQNYVDLVKEARFQNSLRVTFLYIFLTVGGNLLLGLGVALFMNQTFKWRGIARTMILLPWAVAPVISGLMWKWMYNTQFGVFNDILLKLHLVSRPVDWLSSISGTLPAISFSAVWRHTPFVSIIILAGLQTISPELYEAAKVEGASSWRCFFHITLPLIKSVLLIALLFRTVGAFNYSFSLVYVLTGGGPVNTTEVLTLYGYRILFEFLQFGRGSAIAVVISAIIGMIAFAYIKSIGLKRYV